MKTDVAIIGCGVIGSAIAYELARAGLSVVVVDAGDPAAGSTGAALGVLVGISSQQVGGDVVELRLQSWARFDPLIASLESDLGRSLPVNRQGILHLLQAEEAKDWTDTLQARQTAGYRLDLLSVDEVNAFQPGLTSHFGGIYSPQDRQIEPVILTHALVQAAQLHGAKFYFHQPVQNLKLVGDRVTALYTPDHTIAPGSVVVAAGLGSGSVGSLLGLKIPVRPVKGQALQVYAPDVRIRPVVTSEDRHLVPLADGSVWIGATVEFDASIPPPTLAGFQSLIAQAIQVCPGLAVAEIRRSWAGIRPRPKGQRAPILGASPLHQNVILATGHYRNGVLLAPVTAAVVRDLIVEGQTQICDLGKFGLKVNEVKETLA